jgi:hypothetical protein
MGTRHPGLQVASCRAMTWIHFLPPPAAPPSATLPPAAPTAACAPPAALLPAAASSGVTIRMVLSADAMVLSAGAMVLSAGAMVLSAGAMVLSACAMVLSACVMVQMRIVLSADALHMCLPVIKRDLIVSKET